MKDTSQVGGGIKQLVFPNGLTMDLEKDPQLKRVMQEALASGRIVNRTKDDTYSVDDLPPELRSAEIPVQLSYGTGEENYLRTVETLLLEAGTIRKDQVSAFEDLYSASSRARQFADLVGDLKKDFKFSSNSWISSCSILVPGDRWASLSERYASSVGPIRSPGPDKGQESLSHRVRLALRGLTQTQRELEAGGRIADAPLGSGYCDRTAGVRVNIDWAPPILQEPLKRMMDDYMRGARLLTEACKGNTQDINIEVEVAGRIRSSSPYPLTAIDIAPVEKSSQTSSDIRTASCPEGS